MRGRLRAALVWGWALLVVMLAAGVIAYVLAERSAAEQDHRAQVGGTLLAAVVLVPPVLAWAWSRRRSAVPASPMTPARAAADLLATRMTRTWSREVVDRGIQLPAPVQVRWQWAEPRLAVPREQLNASAPAGTDPLPIPGVAVGEVLGSGLVTLLHDEV